MTHLDDDYLYDDEDWTYERIVKAHQKHMRTARRTVLFVAFCLFVIIRSILGG